MLTHRTLALSTLIVAVLALLACRGTDGDLLRTRPEAGTTDTGVTLRPRPEALASWQIQLSGTLDTSFDVRIYAIDLETPPAIIRDLHSAGRIVVCYFSAGTAESFRDDARRFPSASLGQPVADYPDERWIDPRNLTVRAIMADRIAKAASAGCDGIQPSGLAGFAADTGLAFTRADQLDYDRWLASAVHAGGLSVGFVEIDASLAEDLLPDFDWNVAWRCIDAGCPSAAAFVAAGKPALVVEYGDETRAAAVCPAAKSLGMSAVVKRTTALDAYRAGCP